MSTPSVESATEHAVKRHRDKVGRIPRRSGLAPHKRTKATLYTVSMLLETYRDPRAVLLEISSMDTAALAKLCQCSMADALAERRLCAQAVLPFVAQKLPVQVDMRHTRAIVLNIVDDKQYEELVAVAQTDDDNNDSDDSFSMQLIAASPVQETSTQADTTPEPQHTQTKEQEAQTPVTQPVPADSQGPAGGWLRDPAEWWDSAGVRRQPLGDTAPAGPDRWERSRTDSGTWAPDRRKDGG